MMSMNIIIMTMMNMTKIETARPYSSDEIKNALDKLSDAETYGIILRAKGIVASSDGDEWIHFDYVPDMPDVRRGSAGTTGRLCVIGSNINEKAIAELFHAE